MKSVAKIGFQLSDANVHAVTGYCAAEMAIEKANQTMDLPFEIKLELVNDLHDPEGARKAAYEFIKDPEAVAIFGSLNSALCYSSQDIYADAGLPQLTSEASSPMLTNRGFKNFFRLVASDEIQGRRLAQAAVKYLGAKRIAIMHDDSTWGRPIAEIFSQEAESLGCKPVCFWGFRDGIEKDLNFDEMIDAIVDSNPDLVYYAVYWNKAHIITHRLRDRGVKAIFLGSDALKPFPFLEVPSLDTIPPYHSLAGVDIRIKPSARTFFEEFSQKWPTLMVAPQYSAEAYDIGCITCECLRRAGKPDRVALLHELQNLGSFEGAIGHIEFEANGDIKNPPVGLYQCKDGLRNFIGNISDLIE